ncbi:MAG: Ca2+-binding RTX toxin-like protein [Motiliproteus sp.]|jgi:Ca2+-binding RTX toxin-like protein
MATVKVYDIPDLVLAYKNGENVGNSEDGLDLITNVYGLAATILSGTPIGAGANLSAFGLQVANNTKRFSEGTVSTNNILGLTSSSLSVLAAFAVISGAGAIPVSFATIFALAANNGDVDAALTDVTNVLSDPEYWEMFEQNRNELFEPLFDNLTDTGHWIGQNIPLPSDVSGFFQEALDWAQGSDPVVPGTATESDNYTNNAAFTDYYYSQSDETYLPGEINFSDSYSDQLLASPVTGSDYNFNYSSPNYGPQTPATDSDFNFDFDYFNVLNPIYDPIGAFYESKTLAKDPALSIADKTSVLLDQAGKGLTVAALTALDADADGRLSHSELSTLTTWVDANENGLAETGEIKTLAQAGIDQVRETEYNLRSQGNAQVGAAVAFAPVVPGSAEPDWITAKPAAGDGNYSGLRAGDNRFYIMRGYYISWIDWNSSAIKINYKTQNTLIGTEGNDVFDARYYSQYDGVYFTLSKLTNFVAGGGDDRMGGSARGDRLWGGTGNDTLLGYEGNDKLYGESGNDQLNGHAGNDYLDGGLGDDVLLGNSGNDELHGAEGRDELQGGDGADRLSGGADNDRLFGQVGDDILYGGAGDDILSGFTASNEAKQSLNLGESDQDTLYGGAGNDNLFGGLGDDTLVGGTGNDLLKGERGNDDLFGGLGVDELQGGAGDDRLSGGAGNDKLFGQAGNDSLWGGDGDDILQGFKASNEAMQSLAVGETDNDRLYGGAGNDLMQGGLGEDVLHGEQGDDELQGGAGNDSLYGGDGADRLFGQVGDDVLYGGAGDDLLIGFTGNNEAKQTLAAGESDNNWLYGGAGQDRLVGGLGNDYLDGGAGADTMEGGLGDDTYVVNSVNDSILERENGGIDTVVSSSNYLLNHGIENLHLVAGLQIHGTGNALDNVIVGNEHDNILDGVTGADRLIGAQGNDTYYVDNVDDVVVELAGEGLDTVQSSISHTLTANVENLVLLDFSKGEKGLVDGKAVTIYGYPKMNELDYIQGDAVPDFLGTCALTSIANLLTLADQPTSESEVVQLAIDNGWAVTDPERPASERGGSNFVQQQKLLDSYGIRNGLVQGYNEQGMANLIRSGRGVLVAVNAGALWDDASYTGDGGVNHLVTITGVALGEQDGALEGFYIADSGRRQVSDMTRFVSIEEFRAAALVTNAYAIYTKQAIKLWNEETDATGNGLDNTLVGNRADNSLTGAAGDDILDAGDGQDSLDGGVGNDQLSGGRGFDLLKGGEGNDTLMGGQDNDWLLGGEGSDRYVFNAGDGQDVIFEQQASGSDAVDLVAFSDLDQVSDLWFSRSNDHLVVDVLGSDDRVTISGWYADAAQHVEQISAAGAVISDQGVEALVQAMAAFDAPAGAGEIISGDVREQLQPMLASHWQAA